MSSNLPVITSTDQLEELLKQLLTPDNSVIRNAEEILENFTSSNPDCILAFLQLIMKYNALAGVRQMSGVLMRSNLMLHWEKLDQSKQNHVKQSLLECLLKESLPQVRTAMTHAVIAIASKEIPSMKWPELSKYMTDCMRSQESAHRELSLTLFSLLVRNVPEQMLANFDQMVVIFNAGLADSNYNVKLTALRACESLSSEISTEQQMISFLKLLKPIIEIIQLCLQKGDEEEAVNGFPLFTDLLESRFRVKQFDDLIVPLLEFFSGVAKNKQLTAYTRDNAVNFIGWLIIFRSKFVIKKQLIDTLFNILVELLVEPEDDDADQDEPTPFKSASAAFDEFCIKLPSKYTFTNISNTAAQLCSSQNPFHRKAGIAMLGIATEGCNEAIRMNLDSVVQMLLKGFEDSHRQVREATLLAIANFAEYLQLEIVEYYTKIIPGIVAMMDDKSKEVQEKSCYTLDMFCQNIGDKIVPYLPVIMEKLYACLTKGSKGIQLLAIPAIGNVAIAAGEKFIPFFEEVIKMMMTLMQQREKNFLDLRSQATECVGLIAIAVKKDHFQKHVNEFMELALRGLNEFDHLALKETSFGLFGNLSQAFGKSFHVYLPSIMDHLITSAQTDDKFLNSLGFGDGAFSSEDVIEKLEQDHDFDEDEDEEEQGLGTVQARSSLIDEKAEAIAAIGTIARSTRNHFIPYVEKCFNIISEMSTFFHFVIRRNSVLALRDLVMVFIESSEDDQVNTVAPENQQKIGVLLNEVMRIYVTAMEEDDDKETVARVCESISSLCKLLGKNAIQNHIDSIMNQLILLMQRKSVCYEEDEEDEEDEDHDHDIILADAVSDCIDDIARCLGAEFEPYFKQILPIFVGYTKKSAMDDVVMAIGTISEICNAMKEVIKPYAPTILPILLNGLNQQYPNILRNSIYGIGVLSLYSKEVVAPHLSKVMNVVLGIMSQPSSRTGGVIDNCCGMISRVLIANFDGIPVDQFLGLLLSALPLKEDFVENKTVYGSIVGLISSKNPAVPQYYEQIIKVFIKAVASSKMQNEDISKISEGIKQIPNQNIMQVGSSLQPEEQEILKRLLQ